MREGWLRLPLGEVARVVGGFAFPHAIQGRRDGALPFYKVSDMNRPGNETVLDGAENFVSQGDVESLRARVYPAGTVVFPKVGAALLTNKRRVMGRPGLFDNNVMGLIAKDIEPAFLLRLMERVDFNDYVQPGAVPSINGSVVARIEVLVPPRNEQRRIAAMLSAMDAASRATRTVLARLLEAKRALAADLFRAALIGSATIPLGEAGRWLSGGTPSKSDATLWLGSVPWVSPKDMKRLRIDDAIDHVSEAAIGAGTQLAPQSSVLMVVRGMILAHSFPVALTVREVAFNQDIKALVPRGDLDPEYVLYWLEANAPTLLGLVEVANHGTKRLPSESLFATRLPLPSHTEQRSIAATLSGVDAALAAEQRTLRAIETAKNAFMARVLGERS